MSSDLFEVLSLAARYLFTLLGVLIVLRSFSWLLIDHREKHRRLRSLPDAGCVGELVVLSGSPELPEGTLIPVPWEGVLGSVRSCDLVIPCPGVRKRHLSFSFRPAWGLLLRPLSGCEASVNDTLLTCRSPAEETPLMSGGLLRVGSALLRLRLFAGLDHAAPAAPAESSPDPGSVFRPEGQVPAGWNDGTLPVAPAGWNGDTQPVPPAGWNDGTLPMPTTGWNDGTQPVPPANWNDGTQLVRPAGWNGDTQSVPPAGWNDGTQPVTGNSSEGTSGSDQAPARRRRADRWGADFGE